MGLATLGHGQGRSAYCLLNRRKHLLRREQDEGTETAGISPKGWTERPHLGRQGARGVRSKLKPRSRRLAAAPAWPPTSCACSLPARHPRSYTSPAAARPRPPKVPGVPVPTARLPVTSRLLEVSLLGAGTLLLPLPGVPTHPSAPDSTEQGPGNVGRPESEGKQPSEQPSTPQ